MSNTRGVRGVRFPLRELPTFLPTQNSSPFSSSARSFSPLRPRGQLLFDVPSAVSVSERLRRRCKAFTLVWTSRSWERKRNFWWRTARQFCHHLHHPQSPYITSSSSRIRWAWMCWGKASAALAMDALLRCFACCSCGSSWSLPVCQKNVDVALLCLHMRHEFACNIYTPTQGTRRNPSGIMFYFVFCLQYRLQLVKKKRGYIWYFCKNLYNSDFNSLL